MNNEDFQKIIKAKGTRSILKYFLKNAYKIITVREINENCFGDTSRILKILIKNHLVLNVTNNNIVYDSKQVYRLNLALIRELQEKNILKINEI